MYILQNQLTNQEISIFGIGLTGVQTKTQHTPNALTLSTDNERG